MILCLLPTKEAILAKVGTRGPGALAPSFLEAR